jgi:hypothetical protein
VTHHPWKGAAQRRRSALELEPGRKRGTGARISARIMVWDVSLTSLQTGPPLAAFSPFARNSFLV